jgi:pyruvate formate lyase activating enzyme
VGECAICHRESGLISRALGVCAGCILADTRKAREQATGVHARARRQFHLPTQPPRVPRGVGCQRCVNACQIDAGQVGYCGVRHNEDGRLTGGDPEAAAVQWYHDALPTNCVAAWVCPASGPAGCPDFTDTRDAEYGCTNLAVFYEACSFDCLFCQNWHFKSHSVSSSRHSAAEVADAVDSRTRCICFFGGDPSCQIEHSLAAAQLARQQRADRVLRVCWETNGSMSRAGLEQIAEVALQSGGCIKFDLKAWDEPLHRALCGVSNRRTLENFEYLSRWIRRRPEPPLLVAATLLVPGYVEAEQVRRLAGFIARLDPCIPYALLAFHPSFELCDLPTTSRQQAEACLEAARTAGLRRVRIGNMHLLT